MHAYMYVYIHAHINTCVNVYMYAHVCMLYVCIHNYDHEGLSVSEPRQGVAHTGEEEDACEEEDTCNRGKALHIHVYVCICMYMY